MVDISKPVEVEESEKFLELWAQAEDGTRDYPPHSIYLIITAEISQMGKTTLGLRIAEVISERLHGRKWDWEKNIHFDFDPFMEQRGTLSEWDHQVLDEPQRVAGNRDFWSIQNKAFAEELQTNNYKHVHALLPTPHSHLVDTSVYNICTSHAVITSVGHATIYALKRQQLERQWEAHTPKLCWIRFEKPSFWAGFCKMRDEYNEARSKKNVALVKNTRIEAEKVAPPDTIEEIMEKINGNPTRYLDSKTEKVSLKKVQADYPSSMPYNRIQQAVARINTKAELEKAEAGD